MSYASVIPSWWNPNPWVPFHVNHQQQNNKGNNPYIKTSDTPWLKLLYTEIMTLYIYWSVYACVFVLEYVYVCAAVLLSACWVCEIWEENIPP